MTEPTIEELYVEERTFPPPPEFAAAALLADSSHHDEATTDYEAFWARQARELLTWDEDFTRSLNGTNPSRSGSAAVGSTCPTTASTAT